MDMVARINVTIGPFSGARASPCQRSSLPAQPLKDAPRKPIIRGGITAYCIADEAVDAPTVAFGLAASERIDSKTGFGGVRLPVQEFRY
jgi:hypothetical protein